MHTRPTTRRRRVFRERTKGGATTRHDAAAFRHLRSSPDRWRGHPSIRIHPAQLVDMVADRWTHCCVYERNTAFVHWMNWSYVSPYLGAYIPKYFQLFVIIQTVQSSSVVAGSSWLPLMLFRNNQFVRNRTTPLV